MESPPCIPPMQQLFHCVAQQQPPSASGMNELHLQTTSTAPVEAKRGKKRWSREQKRQASIAATASTDEGATEHHATNCLSQKREKKIKSNKTKGATHPLQPLSATEALLDLARRLEYTGAVHIQQQQQQEQSDEQQSDEQQQKQQYQFVQVTTSTMSLDTALPPVYQPHASPTGSVCNIVIKPLLILDVNGILCHRIRKHRQQLAFCVDRPLDQIYRQPVAYNIANTAVVARPQLQDFLDFLSRHFCLAVWTSAKSKNARALVKQLMPVHIQHRLLFLWAQHDCDKVVNQQQQEQQYDEVLFEKNLAKVWQQYPLWNASNTLLMDDSPEKCTAWHANAIHPPPLNGLLTSIIQEENHQISIQQQQQQCAHAYSQQQQSLLLLSDEDNCAMQLEWFQKLVQRWQWHPVSHIWDATNTTTATADSNIFVSSGPSRTMLPSQETLLQFLQQHATGFFRWQ